MSRTRDAQHSRRGGARYHIAGLLLMLSALILGTISGAGAQDGQQTVYVAEIHGTIDLGLAPYLERVLDEANDANAAAVILDINTPGGRLDAALQMRDAILDSPVRTIAFVNREAFSAGALIAIAAEEIYMTPGAVMGAATPVTGSGETADEKTISAVASTFRSTAEQRGRDPQIAAAMVDAEIAIDGLIASGDLLTLTTSEAQEWGYTDGVVEDRQALLQEAGLAGATVNEISPSLAESTVRFLTDPVIASLLFSIGSLLIIADVLTAGIGLLAGAGVGLIAVFFWGHFLAGLAGWEGIALVVLGLLLMAAEVFVIPGFGIAGLLGLASMLGGLYLSLTGGAITTGEDVERALTTVGITFVLLVVGVILLLWLLPTASRFHGMVLQTQLGQAENTAERKGSLRQFGPQPADGPKLQRIQTDTDTEQPVALIGSRGRALSDLRPGGIALINGERVDVVSQGDYITAGEEIEVISDERYRRVVRRVPAGE